MHAKGVAIKSSMHYEINLVFFLHEELVITSLDD